MDPPPTQGDPASTADVRQKSAAEQKTAIHRLIEDNLETNIIGRSRTPKTIKKCKEGIQLKIITFDNLHTVVQVGGVTFPIVARIVEHIECPLILEL